MRIRRSIRCLTAGILAALYLAGCAGKAGSVSETVPETTAAQTETAAKASRWGIKTVRNCQLDRSSVETG